MVSRRFRPHLGVALLVAASLAGCAREGGPAPVVAYGRPGSPPPPPAAVAPEIVPRGGTPHPDAVVVQPGDTLYGVARRYGVPVRSIIEANGLAPPYRVATGTRLALPQLRYHTVQAGDTLYSVSRRYGVDASTLARNNRLAPPYNLRNGETLALPPPVETASAAPAPRPGAPHREASAAALRSEPVPSPRSQIASAVLPAPVPVPPAPATAATTAPPVARAEPPAPAPTGPETKPPAAEAKLASPAAPPQPEAAPSPPPSERLAALPPPAAGKGLTWPVQGRILAGYGPGPGGTHNDGINIAAPEGTPVVAADDGEVAYAGNELRGYGWLILLKHPKSGFTTAYAHNSVLLVKRGDKVKRGQPIARVGSTGAVSEPQLHFEIRRGSRALDPMEQLPAAPVTAAAG